MSEIQVIADRSDIVAIADAVRNKTGNTTELTIDGIVNGINEIKGDGHGDCMSSTDPVGTGSFSMNRLENSEIGEYSFAEGYDNIASGAVSHAEGQETNAGAFGFRIWGVQVDEDGNKAYAVEDEKQLASKLEIGDIFTVYFTNNYDLCGKITNIYIGDDVNLSIGHALIYVDNFIDEALVETPSNTQNIFRVPAKPTVGYIQVANYSHAEGINTNSAGVASHAEGYKTLAAGKYSHVEGRNTEAAYAAHAEGWGTKAHGQESHSEGWDTKALGIRSHSEGSQTTAIGGCSHAEGSGVVAGQKCFNIESFDKDALTITVKDLNNTINQLAIGDTFSLSYSSNKFPNVGTITVINGTTITVSEIPSTFQLDPVWSNRFWVPTKPQAGDVAIGDNSHSQGLNTKATGVASHAEGQLTISGGDNSHAEGNGAQALGVNAHAEGKETKAIGFQSHTEGNNTIAPMHTYNQHVQGRFNIPMDTNYAHVVGNGTSEETRSNAHTLDWNGNAWFAGNVTVGNEQKKLATEEKVNTLETKINGQIAEIGSVRKGTKDTSVRLNSSSNTASGALSTAEGNGTTASGESAHAEGKSTTASGNQSHAEGSGTQATNWNTHAEGVRSVASGEYSHAEGTDTTSEARSSHSEGEGTHARGSYSHAEGSGSETYGGSAHAEGNKTTASGAYSHAENNSTIASGEASHAEGKQTQALGYQSHAEGNNTIASKNTWNQHVQGKFNIPMDNNYAHIVGNGTSESDRRNAHTLDWNGNAWFAGNVSVGANNKKLATEEVVDQKIATFVDSAPETLNTLNELAAALGDDPNFATTVATQLGNKVDKIKGKTLSTNDYTDADKAKLQNLEAVASKYEVAQWTVTEYDWANSYDITTKLNPNTELQIETENTDEAHSIWIKGFNDLNKEGYSQYWSLSIKINEHSDNVSISFPNEIEWFGVEPVFTAGYYYYISFMPFGNKKLGICISKELN